MARSFPRKLVAKARKNHRLVVDHSSMNSYTGSLTTIPLRSQRDGSIGPLEYVDLDDLSGHTEEPWGLHLVDHGRVVARGGTVNMYVLFPELPPKEARANLRLIASAPELLRQRRHYKQMWTDSWAAMGKLEMENAQLRGQIEHLNSQNSDLTKQNDDAYAAISRFRLLDKSKRAVVVDMKLVAGEYAEVFPYMDRFMRARQAAAGGN